MVDRKHTKLAGEVYRTFCSVFDAKHWEYKKSDRKRQLDFPVAISGESVDFTITVDASRQLVRLVARFPEKVSAEKLPEVSEALCRANCKMADGCFDLDLTEESVIFRITAFFHNSSIGEGFVQNKIFFAIACIKKYRPDILSNNKG